MEKNRKEPPPFLEVATLEAEAVYHHVTLSREAAKGLGQSSRDPSRKNRALPTVTDQRYLYPAPGRYTACVKVVDVFGVDTSVTVESVSAAQAPATAK